MLEVVCILVLLMTLECLNTDQILQIVLEQAVGAIRSRTPDVNLLIVNRGLRPHLHTRPTTGMTARVVGPMLVLVEWGKPHVRSAWTATL